MYIEFMSDTVSLFSTPKSNKFHQIQPLQTHIDVEG